MTEKENNGYRQVYLSNNKVDCEVWFAPKDAQIAWPFVPEAPDSSIKSPKYDWDNYRWCESDETAQGKKLAEAEKAIDSLTKAVTTSQASQEAINQQLGSLVTLVSTAVASGSDKGGKK